MFSKESFRIVEVGARDGLQNESKTVPTATKVELIDRLSKCGFKTIEATSFVSPKWVPQMGDHEEVVAAIEEAPGVSYPVLVPNMTGLQKVLKNPKIREIAVFGAASEEFTKKNTNCDIKESMRRLKEVTEAATQSNLSVRGYVSTVIACPYQGKIAPNIVANIAQQLLEFGCYEVSLGDTIGAGSAGSVNALLDEVLKATPVEKLAVHFHDTYGQALSNVLVAIERGIRVADSSVAGLGGCPYAKGATGNLASEDLIYLLNDLGFDTGVNLDAVVSTGDWICAQMGRRNVSRTACALLAKKSRSRA
ncbi:Protein Y71G12B.10 [Aphelenchoides avenae]|nr:Protein Y71G12B.10 [Aphelenchus avenae]